MRETKAIVYHYAIGKGNVPRGRSYEHNKTNQIEMRIGFWLKYDWEMTISASPGRVVLAFLNAEYRPIQNFQLSCKEYQIRP